jgi:replicative DNA helicase
MAPIQAMNKDKLPQSIDAEKGVLCSMMLSEQVVASVVELLTESDFHLPAHRTIWRLLIGIWTEGAPIDLVTLSQRAEDTTVIGSIGGASYLIDLLTCVPTPDNWRFYAETIRENRPTD